MKARSRWICLVTLTAAMAFSAMGGDAVRADVMYPTFTRDSFGNTIFTQPAYQPSTLLGNELTAPDPKNPDAGAPSPLRNPKDVFIDDRDHIYIADTGNNRIVHYDEQYRFVRYISAEESPLRSPEGVFVDKAGHIYIADTGNQRVLHLDADGRVVQEIRRPDSRFIPDNYKFDPVKVVADSRGYLYIVTVGGYRGLLQLDPDGNFQSFYGANRTEVSMLDVIKKTLYPKEMYENEISKVPRSIANVAIGPDGFVYTTTIGDVEHSQIKRLNFEGKNMLVHSGENLGGASGGNLSFGEMLRQRYLESGTPLRPQLVDLAVDSYGNITAIDREYNFVNQYDAYGNLLFFWGGRSSSDSTQLGLIKNPIAVAVNSRNELFILDDQESVLQVFRLSEFGSLVLTANELTINGFYAESEAYWEKVLQLNARYAPAIAGLARAAYQQGDYEKAKELFRRAGDQSGFSDSFWQIRLAWFQQRFSTFATAMLILSVAYLAGGRLWRRRTRREAAASGSPSRIAEQWKHAFYMLRHPIDGFTALRFEGKGGYGSALVILLFTYVALLVHNLHTSFVFHKIEEHSVSAFNVLVQFAVVWLAWVVCNYLISSIYRGEGRFKDVFVGSAYALIPFALGAIPLAVLSNAMTLSEQAIYQYLFYGLIVWSGAMVFWKVQALQNYGVWETIVNIFLTLVAMVVLGVLAFIVFGLTNELRMFVFEVYQEVAVR